MEKNPAAPLVSGVPGTMEVVPGVRARFAFRVQNTSDILDDFTVILRDIDERWYSLESGSKLLFPGEDREVALEFLLPVAPPPTSGEYPGTMTFRSVTHRLASSSWPFVVAVASVDGSPGDKLEIAIVPQLSTSHAHISIEVFLQTSGNTADTVVLALTDPADLLWSELSLDRVTVVPGIPEVVFARIGVKRPPWFAAEVTYPFEILVSLADGDGAEIKRAEGILTYRGRLAWVPGLFRGAVGTVGAVLALLVVVVMFVLIAAPLFQSPVAPPPVPDTPTAVVGASGSDGAKSPSVQAVNDGGARTPGPDAEVIAGTAVAAGVPDDVRAGAAQRTAGTPAASVSPAVPTVPAVDVLVFTAIVVADAPAGTIDLFWQVAGATNITVRRVPNGPSMLSEMRTPLAPATVSAPVPAKDLARAIDDGGAIAVGQDGTVRLLVTAGEPATFEIRAVAGLVSVRRQVVVIPIGSVGTGALPLAVATGQRTVTATITATPVDRQSTLSPTPVPAPDAAPAQPGRSVDLPGTTGTPTLLPSPDGAAITATPSPDRGMRNTVAEDSTVSTPSGASDVPVKTPSVPPAVSTVSKSPPPGTQGGISVQTPAPQVETPLPSVVRTSPSTPLPGRGP